VDLPAPNDGQLAGIACERLALGVRRLEKPGDQVEGIPAQRKQAGVVAVRSLGLLYLLAKLSFSGVVSDQEGYIAKPNSLQFTVGAGIDTTGVDVRGRVDRYPPTLRLPKQLVDSPGILGESH
jgi:hypothetical protein